MVSNHEADELDFFEIICFVESSGIYNEILPHIQIHRRKILIFLQSY
jgi:hypothetical protein